MKNLVAVLCLTVLSVPMTFAQDATITAMEYYIDSDPGVGNGTTISFTAGASVSFSFSIATGSLSPGMHTLVIRARDQNNDWSIHESRTFFVSVSSFVATANVSIVEYFFDSDPGFGNGTSLSITPGTTLNIFHSISGLTPGFHVLHYRGRDSDGVWGITESRPVYVTPYGTVTQATITSMEYFFDTDPGYGNGSPITMTSAANLNLQSLIASAALSPGFHTLSIRARDNDGQWGMAERRSFFIDGLANISGVEYYIDTDPGVGNATSVPVAPPQPDIDLDLTIATTSLSTGTHTLGVRVRRTDNTWSDTQTSSFSICTNPDANFTASTVCAGAATTFSDASVTQAGDLYSWDFNTDGTVDATSVGNASFTYATAGTYTATLTITRGACSDVATTTVTVAAVPVVNAGPDQAVCSNSVSLNASPVGPGFTGTWTIQSGTGTFANANAASTTFSGVSTFSNTLVWTVVNTVAGCSGSDQVVIVSNQPITAGAANATVSLGQSVAANVQGAATTNPGDVVTTTIVSAPAKGSASVQSDGRISFTPNTGTVGADTLRFRLCNQCNQCSENNLIIEILNNAPVITPPSLTAAPGDTVTLNLLAIITDVNNNLDPSTLKITQQPLSGARAVIDASFNLILDYSGIFFSGTDQIIIEVCDLSGVCSSNTIFVDVESEADPPITVFNALSPNDDNAHDFLEIENITAYPRNHVYIFNRWGTKVYEAFGYNNQGIRFNGTSNLGGGKELPGGTYYYSIVLKEGDPRVTGYLVIKR